MRKEEVEEAELDVEPGSVLEVASLKELGAFLGRKEVWGFGNCRRDRFTAVHIRKS